MNSILSLLNSVEFSESGPICIYVNSFGPDSSRGQARITDIIPWVLPVEPAILITIIKLQMKTYKIFLPDDVRHSCFVADGLKGGDDDLIRLERDEWLEFRAPLHPNSGEELDNHGRFVFDIFLCSGHESRDHNGRVLPQEHNDFQQQAKSQLVHQPDLV